MKRPIPIYLAVEDDLSERVVRRLLSTRPIHYAIGAVYGGSGYGYLKKQAVAFNNAAKGCPFLLLTDLDQHECPPELITDWLDPPKHAHFLLRVAVREVESWLLGDLAGLGAFLGIRKLPTIPNPEAVSDPKQQLLKLAMRCPSRQTRDALVWRDHSSGRHYQGPDYNGTLARYVASHWDLRAARRSCRSLERFWGALGRLEADF